MTRVEPHLYMDTPIFRGLLYERDGRFPGTPEGVEELPEIKLSEMVPAVSVSERLTSVVPLAMMAVIPIEKPTGEITQAISFEDLNKA